MFETYRPTVWRMLCQRGVDSEAAADLTQQAFLIAAERLDQIRPGCERAFLWGTGLRLAIAACRRARRTQLEEDMDLRRTVGMRADEIVDKRRALQALDRVVGKLPPELREVFVLFECEGFSTKEISKSLGIPMGTVASRLRRARVAFRAEAQFERVLARIPPPGLTRNDRPNETRWSKSSRQASAPGPGVPATT